MNPSLEILQYSPVFTVKAVDGAAAGQGRFEGVLSVYGVEDLYGDVIDKGAFTKTLQENPNVPVLWQHMRDEVIGGAEVRESGNKILIRGELDIEDDQTALKAFKKIKSGRIKGLSIGFQALKTSFEEVTVKGARKMIRHIVELKLWEGSIVTFPALPMAAVTRVKAAAGHSFEELRSWEAEALLQMRSLDRETLEKVQTLLSQKRAPTQATSEEAGAVPEAVDTTGEPEPDFHSLHTVLKEMLK